MEFLSVEDICARWKVQPTVVYGLRYRNAGPPAVRVGRELRFRIDDVEQWERDHQDPGPDRAA